MNLLSQSARIYRQNVCCSLFVSSSPATSAYSKRSLNTSELKKYSDLLNVNKNSTPKDIKDSFIKLSKLYHPDNRTTGSHGKFVELKEAYDALKDGHPTISDASSARANNFNNYYNTDNSYQAHKAYREQSRDYQTAYEHKTYGFGGPYRYSSKPWEQVARDREFRRQQARKNSFGRKGEPLVSLTLILSAMAWIVIYAGFMFFLDYQRQTKKALAEHYNSQLRTKNYPDYQAYEDYIYRKEADRRSNRKRGDSEDLSEKLSDPLSMPEAPLPSINLNTLNGT